MQLLTGQRKRAEKIARKLPIYLLVILSLMIMLTPVVWLVLTSIRPMKEIQSPRLNLLPDNVVVDNYVDVFKNYDMAIYLRNSIIVSVAVVVTNLIIGSPAGYAMARYSFRGETIIFLVIIVMRMIPVIAVIVPLFILFSNLNLLNTYASLIIAQTAFKLPVTVWLLRGFFAEIPRELTESARVDGCSPLGAMLRIAVPLVKPGLAATAIMAFLETWNDLIVTLVLSNTMDTEMISLGLAKFVLEYGVDWGPLTAAGTLMFVPTLAFVLVAERYLVRGLTLGAVK